MVTNGNYSFGGKNFIMYVIAKSLCYTPKTNIVLLYVKYTSIKKKVMWYNTVFRKQSILCFMPFWLTKTFIGTLYFSVMR